MTASPCDVRMLRPWDSADAAPSTASEHDKAQDDPATSCARPTPAEFPVPPPTTVHLPRGAEQWMRLRHFHLGDRCAADGFETVDGCFPALLGPYADRARLRFDYPLLLHHLPPGSDADASITPLGEFLLAAAANLDGEPEGGRILRDNLTRFEARIQDALAKESDPIAAKPLLVKAGESIQSELALSSPSRARLAEALNQLSSRLSDEARLLGYGSRTGAHLLIHTAQQVLIPQRLQFTKAVAELVGRLRELLSLEWAQSETSGDPGPIEGRVGAAGARLLDAAALARLMDHARGSERMSTERRERVEKALKVLQGYLDQHQIRLMTIIHPGEPAHESEYQVPPLVYQERSYICQFRYSAAPCIEAPALFDAAAQELAPVLTALRIARLELAGQYDPAVHDATLSQLSWESFAENELQQVTAIVAILSADTVATNQLPSLSQLLRSHRPVQVLVNVDAATDAEIPDTDGTSSEQRLEIGYLGLSHRQAWVNQSASARPHHLTEGFRSAFRGVRPALHVLLTDPGQTPMRAIPPLHPWLHAGAAIEGRGYPLFHFAPSGTEDPNDPGQLLRTGHLDLQDNPQADQDWPAYPLRHRDGDAGEPSQALRFTFVDFAVLEPILTPHFRLIPEGIENEALTPLDSYLSLPVAETGKRLPYIWVMDPGGGLRRAVPTRDLVFKARDRLDYWRTLQALAGVRNPFVEQARRQALSEAAYKAKQERDELEERLRMEIERVRRETARTTMSRLTAMLLELDLTADRPMGGATSIPPEASQLASPPIPPEATSPMVSGAEGSVNDHRVVEEETWIDTPLCTSCNDCIQINPRLFVYDDNKQARIGDPRAGTYAQLVEAAERCPVRCIHPGQPLDASEAGIDALLTRAALFN